jgi:hypothetical protein
VADWGQRAKDKDRDNAIREIEAAAARGQIIEVDRLKRVMDVKAAHTVGEIELITRGLAMPEPAGAVPPTAPPIPTPVPAEMPPPDPTFEPYSPPQTPPVTEPDPSFTPPANIQYGEPLSPSAGTPITYGTSSTRSGGGAKFVWLFVAILIAGISVPIIIGIKSVVDTAGGVINELNPETPDVISTEGLADLTAALKKETGSTEAFRVVLYPEYAVVTAPADANSKRSINYYWNGNLRESNKGTETNGTRFDLAEIDAAVLTKLLGQVRKIVEGATTQYVVVSPPFVDGQEDWISAHATNEFNESGYVSATLDGKVVRKVKPS